MQDSQPSLACLASNPMLDCDRFLAQTWRVHAAMD